MDICLIPAIRSPTGTCFPVKSSPLYPAQKRAEMFLRASLETARILLNYQPATVSMMTFKTPIKPRSPKSSDPAHYLNLTTV
jgi:hypothetical protein